MVGIFTCCFTEASSANHANTNLLGYTAAGLTIIEIQTKTKLLLIMKHESFQRIAISLQTF